MIVGIGIDCEEIERWEGLSKDAPGDPRYALFSDSEHDYCSKQPTPAQHYAGRWCLKEATVKAIGSVAKITTRDVEIHHVPGANPAVVVAAYVQIEQRVSFLASVTHSEKTAAAVVVIEAPGLSS